MAYPFCALLAASLTGAGALPYRVAALIALQVGRYINKRDFQFAESIDTATGQDAAAVVISSMSVSQET